MKIAPVSGDLLIKLALGAAVVGGAWYVVRAVKDGFGEFGKLSDNVFDSVSNVVQYVNPASDKNLIYQSVNAIGAAVAGVDSKNFSFGAALYEQTHPYADTMTPKAAIARMEANSPITAPKLPSAYFSTGVDNKLQYPSYITDKLGIGF